ncbi:MULTISPECIES: hypothetical protein [Sphingobacterium]|uniref:hypothetical protein n=1 Tax=Sphingobacterium TaxID=28453 RepID=UPI00257ADF61|nr:MULTISPECIES: hypothetical protein [Sphingobacterium]
MKVLKLTVESLLISMLFNLIGNHGIYLNRFWTQTYWMWTVAFAIAIGIAVVFTQMFLKAFWTYWQKRYSDLILMSKGRIQTDSIPKGQLFCAILATTIPILSIYLFFIYCFAYMRSEDTYSLLRSYLLHYMPFIVTGCVAYVIYVFHNGKLWWLTTENVKALLGKEIMSQENTTDRAGTIAPPSALDRTIVIGSLYDVLYKDSPFNLNTLRMDTVRMFDVPFYFSQKRKKEVVLINGTRVEAHHFMQELEARGLDKWYFRINKTCRVNMMHVRQPILPNATYLEFRKEVFDSLKLNMTELEISNLLQITEWMRKEKKLKDFLDNVNNLEHEGWDDLLPLN